MLGRVPEGISGRPASLEASLDSTLKRILFWGVIIVLGVMGYQFTNKALQTGYKVEKFSDFYKKMQGHEIRNAAVTGNTVQYETASGDKFRTVLPTEGAKFDGLMNKLLEQDNIEVTANDTSTSNWTAALFSWEAAAVSRARDFSRAVALIDFFAI